MKIEKGISNPEWDRKVWHFQHLMKIEFSAIEKMIFSQELSWRKIIKKTNDELGNLEVIQKAEFLMYVSTANHLIIRIQRNSTFVALFSYFEKKLRDFCKIISAQYPDFQLKPQSKYHECYGSLNNWLREESNGLKAYWKPIYKHNLTRNILAHSGGLVDPAERDKVEIENGLRLEKDSIDGSESIYIYNFHFLLSLKNRMQAFLIELINKAQARNEKLKKNK